MKRLLCMTVVTALATLLLGCGNTVTVHYRQLATTAQVHGYNGPIERSFPDDLWIVYEICAVENVGRNAEQAIFSLQKIYAEEQGNLALGPSDFHSSFSTSVFNAADEGGLRLTDPQSPDGQILLARGTTVNANRRIIVRVKGLLDGNSVDREFLETIKVALSYHPLQAEPGAVFVRETEHEPKRQYVEVLDNAQLPQRLRSPLCDE